MADTARFEVFPKRTEASYAEYPSVGEVYTRWYWRLVAANGEVLALSSKCYRDKPDAKRGVTEMCYAIATVTEVREVGL